MSANDMKTMRATSYLSGGNADYLEELYEDFLHDPESVTAEWRNYFQSLPRVNGFTTSDVSHAAIRNQFLNLAKQPIKITQVSSDALQEHKQACVEQLVQAYYNFGHLAAKTNPLLNKNVHVPELDMAYYDLSPADYERKFFVPSLFKDRKATLKEICETLNTIYCGPIGTEFSYIRNQEEVNWLHNYFQSYRDFNLSNEEKLELLKQLTAADGLEKYLQNRFLGQKRFSLEGGDSYIPFMRELSNYSAAKGVKEIIIGMAHRGRLNTLVNILGQSPEQLFQEFEGKKDYGLTSGDVKYHLGFSSDIKTPAGPLHLSLAFNPSHLEFINAVAMGKTRAHQDRRGDKDRKEAMTVLVHGDASFAGQGIVMETLNMSLTRAYKVGGTVHIIINNQVGFTTSNPHDARSSLYCSDIAKIIDAPVFHVNGDEPEAVVFLARLAVDYRARFNKDIVIDLVCYRRLGHNEADEPAATQPVMYNFIRSHLTPRELYGQSLVEQKICSKEDVDTIFSQYRDALDAGRPVVPTFSGGLTHQYGANWTPYLGQEWNVVVDTAVKREKLIELALKLEQLPKGFTLQRQVANMMATRSKMTQGEHPLDWGYAETLAYATLVDEGWPVRLSGQDCGRGTFAHRHAVLHDQNSGETYTPLQHLNSNQARFEVYDSLLSESGVVGFEYGYASSDPHCLVLWEAQFGDFANGAQVIIDQFISSGWQKWKRLCGLSLLLPHGYEGAGPEHSSARLERYLQLCAEYNMQVCIPSTPAQIFHLLRRQVIRPYRVPMIILTPKSLLRHKLAVSSLDDLAKGKFQLVIPEIDPINPTDVNRIILCSGKVYYDLLTYRREQKIKDVAIIRLEQQYPFPYDELQAEISRYKKAKLVVWCQEEPRNQGAWYINRHRYEKCLAKDQELYYAGRESSAAPAAGYMSLHQMQQNALITQAFGDTTHLVKS